MSLPAKQAATGGEIMESVLIKGDLAKLTEGERVQYYNAVCKSIGLNPFTRPFDYITLNGKLQLYAKRDACDQLRKIQNISLHVISAEMLDGIYTVHVKAKTPEGREDEDFGAVSLPDTTKGEIRANLILKAITKAKRRATLSICGLGFLDETEVEDIPSATPSRQHINPSSRPAETPRLPLKEELNDEIPGFGVDTIAPEGAAASPSPTQPSGGATPSADLRFLYAAASEAAQRGEKTLKAFFRAQSKDAQAELRKIEPELVALYPK